MRNEAAQISKRTVLLVEDDVAVRLVTSTILKKAGFRVVEKAAPSEVMGAEIEPFDLLLTDGAMAEPISGPELGIKLRTRFPGLPVICMTGYSADALQISKESGFVVLEKPFDSNRLIDAVFCGIAGCR